MNKKGFSSTGLLVVAILLVIVIGGGYLLAKNRSEVSNINDGDSVPTDGQALDEATSNKLKDVYNISNATHLSRDLELYFGEKGRFPTTLSDFFDDSSYTNRTFAVRSEDRGDLIKRYTYKISSDAKSYVLAYPMLLTKSELPAVNNDPTNSVTGTILGINCSDQKIFCLFK